MADKNNCICPLCEEHFIFDEDRLTADEHLARGVKRNAGEREILRLR